jgi:hypothetical protein
VTHLPEWMTDAGVCAGMALGCIFRSLVVRVSTTT